MVTRLNDLMKSKGITALYTDLIKGDISPEPPEMYVSSMIDTWIMLRNFEYNGERSRGLTVLKSRGMAHSNQIREFIISEKGVELIMPYIGPAGVFMGSAKIVQEAKDNAQIMDIERNIEHKRETLQEKHKELEAKITALKAQYKTEENELARSLEQIEQNLNILMTDRKVMKETRK